MVWQWLRDKVGAAAERGPKTPLGRRIGRLSADDNPWNVPLFDFREATLESESWTTDKQHAQNLVSMQRETGVAFTGEAPRSDRWIDADLRFPIDTILADGVLFSPAAMEHKWGLYFHAGQILCVRSWLRTVEIVADVEFDNDQAVVKRVTGTFADEAPPSTIRLLDYLLRTHALGVDYPVPLADDVKGNAIAAQAESASLFGHFALFGAIEDVPWQLPDRPLRTSSLLHIAVAQDDGDEVDRQLAAGVPIDLLAADGLAPLHWSMAAEGDKMARRLLDRGADVDVRSDDGATPLMNAVQGRHLETARLFLKRGADASARDHRGFTSLHRAAEMGEVELVDLLLRFGADGNAEAEGHTPLSFAVDRGHEQIARRLRDE